MDDWSYGVLALALTVAAGTWTWYAYRRRGLGPALKGAGLTLLPAAAYLTDTLEMLARVGDAIGDWALGLVLSPAVWVGIVLAGLGVVLFGSGRVVQARAGDEPPTRRTRKTAGTGPEQLPPSRPAQGLGQPAVGDDMADIEALLKSRGIT